MKNIIAAFALCCCAPVPVLAQGTTLPFRLFMAFDGSYQATSSEFRDGRAFTTHAEEGRLDADYAVTRGPGFDVTAGAMVRRGLALAVSASRFQPVDAGAVPHASAWGWRRRRPAVLSGLLHSPNPGWLRAGVTVGGARAGGGIRVRF